MKEMTEETILSILDAITPDTSWYGESSHDEQSLDNLIVLEKMIYQLADQLTDSIDVGLKNRGNGSANSITKLKYNIVRFFFYDYFADAKCAIEEELCGQRIGGSEMTDQEALRVALYCVGKRISELEKTYEANSQGDTKHYQIVHELWNLMQAETALTNMEIDEDEKTE